MVCCLRPQFPRLREIAHTIPAGLADTPCMSIYGSLDRLNAMASLFTTQGNGTLDVGEVDAIAAFDKALPAASRQKLHQRMIELYQDSKFSSGQKGRMLELLQGQGFTLLELEKVDPQSAAAFAKLSKAAQESKIRELGGLYSDENNTKPQKLSGLDTITRGKLQAAMNKAEKDIKKEHGAQTEVAPAELKAVFTVNAAGKDEKVGYVFLMPYYTGHDGSREYYFNLKGEGLGFEKYSE